MGHNSLRKVQPWISNAAYGITLLMIGAIMGTLVDNYLKAGFSPDYITITVLLLVQVTILAYARNHLFQDIGIKEVMHDIEQCLGLKVLYQDVNTLNQSKIDYVKDVVSTAEQEILILDINYPSTKREDYYIDPKIRIDYYDVIFNRVEEQSVKGIPFVYKRICQFSSSTDTFKHIDDMLFLEHCREMLIYKQQKGQRVYLKKASIIYSTTFYIIDKKYIVLNIINTKVVNGHLQHYLKGEMIIHDPQQQLATIFLSMWEEIDNDSSCVSVHTTDLEENPPKVA